MIRTIVILCTILGLILSTTNNSAGQVGFNNPNPDASSILDLKSTDKGLLIPRMTSDERKAITTPAPGLLVFDTEFKMFFFFDGSKWVGLNPWKYLEDPNQVEMTTEAPTTTKVNRLHVEGFSSNALVPSGAILMWSGDENTVPEGWALCNGQTVTYEGRTTRTPDLKGRFVVGYDPSDFSYDDPGALSAGNTSDTGETGGRRTVTLSGSNLPRHRHSIDITTSGPSTTTNPLSPNGGIYQREFDVGLTRTHTIQTLTARGVLQFRAEMDHTHTIDGDTGFTGSSTPAAVENRPPYYVLAYIIKL